jgi:Fuc2NAc and GlcNAc transferase
MYLTFSLLLVFATAFLATGLWLALAQRRRWFDHPNHRSSHVVPTPKSGGAGFVVVFTLFAWALYLGQQLTLDELLLVASALILAVTGFADDLRPLGIWQRVGLQIVSAALALILLESVPPLVFPWGEFDPAWLRGCMLAAGLVWLINLYNFMDGIDGLAAMETIFFCLSLALLTGSGSAPAVTTLSLGLALAVSGFLYFNLAPARLFMGDLGSNYLGFMLGVLGGLAILSESVNVWTLLVLLGVFIVDSTVTLAGRMRAGLVWYHAHRSHAYQQAALRLNSHGKVVLAVALINIGWLLPLAWLTTVYGDWGLLLTFVAWLPLYVLGRLVRQPLQVATEASQAAA